MGNCMTFSFLECCLLLCPFFFTNDSNGSSKLDQDQQSRPQENFKSSENPILFNVSFQDDRHKTPEEHQIVVKLEDKLKEEMDDEQSNKYDPEFHLPIDDLEMEGVQQYFGKAVILEEEGQTRKAEQIFKQLLKWIKKEDLENQEEVQASVNASLALLLSKNNHQECWSYLKETEEIYQKEPSKYIQEHITLLSNMGTNLYSKKDYKSAKELFEKALNLSEKYFFNSDERKYSIINNLICLQFALNKRKEAQKLYKQACLDLQKFEGENLLEMKKLLNSNYQFCIKQMSNADMQDEIKILEPSQYTLGSSITNP